MRTSLFVVLLLGLVGCTHAPTRSNATTDTNTLGAFAAPVDAAAPDDASSPIASTPVDAGAARPVVGSLPTPKFETVCAGCKVTLTAVASDKSNRIRAAKILTRAEDSDLPSGPLPRNTSYSLAIQTAQGWSQFALGTDGEACGFDHPIATPFHVESLQLKDDRVLVRACAQPPCAPMVFAVDDAGVVARRFQ